MNCTIFLLSFYFSFQVFAQAPSAEEMKYLGYIYQQKEHLLNDSLGDRLLLHTANQIPKFIMASLKGKAGDVLKDREENIKRLLEKYPEYSPNDEFTNYIVQDHVKSDLSDEAIPLEGRKAPFKVNNMVNMLKAVITEEYRQNGIQPKEGTIHEWSPQTRKEIKNEFKLFSRMPKLLVALSRGSTSYFMVSGTENSLQNYIVSRPDNSINLEEMFRASYRVNNGDVYLSLLTIENVLSRYWLTAERNKRVVTTKLKDITNHNYETDKFGAWYHLFGIMLYGYAYGSLEAKIVGNLESIGSSIMSKFKEKERQEQFINSRGGPIGGRIRKFVKDKKYETFALDPNQLKEDSYMDLEEDFSKRLVRAKKKKSIQ